MDGREGMALAGSAAYYFGRGGGTGGSRPVQVHGGGEGSPSPQTGRIHHPTPSFKNNTNPIIPFQTNVGLSGGVSNNSAFHLENPQPSFPHTVDTAPVPTGSQSSQPLKKKRGRPRKYGPGGANMALGLSPLSAPKPSSSAVVSPGEKGRRGRPPGTGWKQKLAPLGEWMNNSAGLAFTPHVLRVGVGEDISGKILAFAQQRPRALCIMSANGSVSTVTLRQPTNTGETITYEGRFEILCLSGSYLVTETGGPRDRTGGISISVCSPDGHVIGGAIGGKLIAADPVQVVGCSFVYGNAKVKSKDDSATGKEKIVEHSSEKSPTAVNTTSTLSFSPASGPSIWPLVSRSEVRNSQKDIDLTRG